jgi:predicted ATPase/DNA-binding CsgD family transcriptional regulator/transcriptional regulator with XRE-family HTH domain
MVFFNDSAFFSSRTSEVQVENRLPWNRRLRLERLQQGWSQGEVAKAIKTNPKTVSRWERGQAFPSRKYRSKLCQLYEKNADELGLIEKVARENDERQFSKSSIEHKSVLSNSNIIDFAQRTASPSSGPIFIALSEGAIKEVGANALTPESRTSPLTTSSTHFPPTAKIVSRQRAIPEQIPKHNLPIQITPLIGREQELKDACALLLRPETRLLTLTGAGGVGKTSLGLQIATNLLDIFVDGVYFVSLASISEVDLVLYTIAQTLGFGEAGKQSPLELLKDNLRGKELLILIDNFEQVAAAAPLLEELIATCPKLKLLVTSRTVLHSRNEQEFPVPPLALPNLKNLPGVEELSRFAAVSLFIQRSQVAKPDFRMNNSNAHAIAAICVHLDGLPLAIELAAAWIKLLPPQTLLARLGPRSEILTNRGRNVPIRQQTLRNTLIWSYNLLDAQEQWLFRILSIFVSGCTLEAIEVICNSLDSTTKNILGTTISLIDKNLLQQIEQVKGVPRLMMMATIREYGLECLASHGQVEVTRRAHALYYLKLVEEIEPKLVGVEQQSWFEVLEREYENLQAALHWSVERGELEIALRLGGALWRFWLVRGYVSEELLWLEQAIQGIKEVKASVRAKALISAGALAYHRGDIVRAMSFCRESLALFQDLGEIQGVAYSLHRLGLIASQSSDYSAAQSLEEEALQLFKEVGDKAGIAYSLTDLAYVAMDQGEFVRARSLAEEGLALFRSLGDKRGIVYSLLRLGRVYYFSQEDQVRAYALAEEAQKIAKEISYKWGVASSLGLLGQLTLNQGDISRARSLLEDALVIRRELGDRWGIAWGLYSLGWVEFNQSNYSAAKALFEECFMVLRELNDMELMASVLEALGGVVSSQGDPTWAAQLWGAAESLRETINAPITPVNRETYERFVAAARAKLSKKDFSEAWAVGRTMAPGQAIIAHGQTKALNSILSAPILSPTTVPSSTFPAGLTAREVEVLRWVASGLTDGQVAEKLTVSPRTVSTHLRSIYNKLGVNSRSGATRFAVEQHLI